MTRLDFGLGGGRDTAQADGGPARAPRRDRGRVPALDAPVPRVQPPAYGPASLGRSSSRTTQPTSCSRSRPSLPSTTNTGLGEGSERTLPRDLRRRAPRRGLATRASRGRSSSRLSTPMRCGWLRRDRDGDDRGARALDAGGHGGRLRLVADGTRPSPDRSLRSGAAARRPRGSTLHSAMGDFIWTPSDDVLESANVVRPMRRHGFEDYWSLVRRSQDDPAWFWPAGRGHGPRVLAAVGRGSRRLARARVDDVVRGREAEPRLEPVCTAGPSGARMRSARVFLGEDGSRREVSWPSSPTRSPGGGTLLRSASSPATASVSTSPCAPKSPSPRTRARTSARCRCRSSRASQRPPSRSASRTRKQRS